MTMDLKSAFEWVGKIGTVVGTISGAYLFVGGPLPATRTYVHAQLIPVNRKLDGVNLSVLEQGTRINGSTRIALINERGALERTLSKGDALDDAARATLTRRMSEVDNALRALQRDDDALWKAMEALK